MKKINKILLLVILITIICLIVYLLLQKTKKDNLENEYEPETEISDTDERKTMISLYFENKTNGKIEPEGRLIDVKELIDKPYSCLLKLLIDGPKNDNLISTIPKETRINNIYINGDMLVIDLSKEFIINHPGTREKEENTINSIVKTMTELSEVNSVKILIDGEENKEFNDKIIKFDKEFVRIE